MRLVRNSTRHATFLPRYAPGNACRASVSFFSKVKISVLKGLQAGKDRASCYGAVHIQRCTACQHNFVPILPEAGCKNVTPVSTQQKGREKAQIAGIAITFSPPSLLLPPFGFSCKRISILFFAFDRKMQFTIASVFETKRTVYAVRTVRMSMPRYQSPQSVVKKAFFPLV